MDGESYRELLDLGRPVLFFGSGMAKWRDTFNLAGKNDNAVFVDGVEPLAVDMIALAERDFNQRKFIDTAYSTPLYLKEFQATTPKNKVLNNEKN